MLPDESLPRINEQKKKMYLGRTQTDSRLQFSCNELEFSSIQPVSVSQPTELGHSTEMGECLDIAQDLEGLHT